MNPRKQQKSINRSKRVVRRQNVWRNNVSNEVKEGLKDLGLTSSQVQETEEQLQEQEGSGEEDAQSDEKIV